MIIHVIMIPNSACFLPKHSYFAFMKNQYNIVWLSMQRCVSSVVSTALLVTLARENVSKFGVLVFKTDCR